MCTAYWPEQDHSEEASLVEVIEERSVLAAMEDRIIIYTLTIVQKLLAY